MFQIRLLKEKITHLFSNWESLKLFAEKLAADIDYFNHSGE